MGIIRSCFLVQNKEKIFYIVAKDLNIRFITKNAFLYRDCQRQKILSVCLLSMLSRAKRKDDADDAI